MNDGAIAMLLILASYLFAGIITASIMWLAPVWFERNGLKWGLRLLVIGMLWRVGWWVMYEAFR